MILSLSLGGKRYDASGRGGEVKGRKKGHYLVATKSCDWNGFGTPSHRREKQGDFVKRKMNDKVFLETLGNVPD